MRPTSSTLSAPRSASGAEAWPPSTPPIWAPTSSRRSSSAPASIRLAVEDVFFGCVDTIGPQAGDIARTCWLAAGLPEEVPGTTIDRQCGSSQQALHFAAQAVMSGTYDVVIAGGVQNMSMIPISSAMTAGRAARLRRPLLRFGGLAGPLRRSGGLAVPGGRDDRREVGDHPGGHGGLRAAVPRAGPAGRGRGPLRGRDRTAGRRHRRRGSPPSHSLEKMAVAAARSSEAGG